MISLNFKTLNAQNKIISQYIFDAEKVSYFGYEAKTEWKFFVFSWEMSPFMSRTGFCALLGNCDSPTLEA